MDYCAHYLNPFWACICIHHRRAECSNLMVSTTNKMCKGPWGSKENTTLNGLHTILVMTASMQSIAKDICYSKLNMLVFAHSNMSICQQCHILAELTGIVYIMVCWMLYFVWYKAVFLTVHSLWSLHVLNMFLSWILSYQNLHMIALPGLIISILFCCRIAYSIIAHFICSIYTFKSLTQDFTILDSSTYL